MRSNRKEAQKKYFITVGGINLVECVSHNSGRCHFWEQGKVIWRNNLEAAQSLCLQIPFLPHSAGEHLLLIKILLKFHFLSERFLYSSISPAPLPPLPPSLHYDPHHFYLSSVYLQQAYCRALIVLSHIQSSLWCNKASSSIIPYWAWERIEVFAELVIEEKQEHLARKWRRWDLNVIVVWLRPCSFFPVSCFILWESKLFIHATDTALGIWNCMLSGPIRGLVPYE